MWTPPERPLAIEGVSAATLRRVSAALRSGQLALPLSPFALAAVADCPAALAADLQRLSGDGLSAAHLTLIVDLAAAAVEARLQGEAAAELVWSGPEPAHARSRDTLAVLDELFSSAERSVLLSTYVVHQPERVFATLAARLDAISTLQARLFVHVERKPGDTRLNAALLSEYASWLGNRWPGSRRPELYYDPRGLSIDPHECACWHAKCVLVDDRVAFVTSANFTEWAQERNVEAGVLIRSRYFTRQLRGQLEALIESRHVRRLTGF